MRQILISIALIGLAGCGQDPNTAVGTLEWDRVELIAERSEPIVEIQHREGDRLAEGEVILRLDPRRAQARASERERELDLERLTVRSPRDGRLDDLPYRLGEQPAVGKVVALMLAGPAPYARVYVPEAIRARVAPGTGARIAVDGLDTPFAGRVRKVLADPAFTPYYALTERDRGRLTYLAEIDLQDAPESLPAGVPLVASFQLDTPSAP